MKKRENHVNVTRTGPRRHQQQRVLALSGAAQARGEPQAGPVMSV